MAKGAGKDPKPLDRETEAAVAYHLERFRTELMECAARVATDGGREAVTAGDIEVGYTQTYGRLKSSRSSAQKYVRTALRENRLQVYVYVGMAVVLFLAGLIFFGYATFGPTDSTGRHASLAAGISAELWLIWPMRVVIDSRRQNVAIQMFGYLLDHITDDKLIADLIRRLLGELSPEPRHRGKR
jgi:hypothetical protein